MTTHARTSYTPSSSLAASQGLSPSNHIDLTLDDDDNPNNSFHDSRTAKRPRIEHFSSPTSASASTSLWAPYPAAQQPASPSTMSVFSNYTQRATLSAPNSNASSFMSGSLPPPFTSPLQASSSALPYRPPYASQPASSSRSQQHQHQQTQLPNALTRSSSFPSFSPPLQPKPSTSQSSNPPIIDLTNSPSPPPNFARIPPPSPSASLSPKTPVCIGQLTVTALVLYPVSYLNAGGTGAEPEWAPVKLHYEPNLSKPPGNESIHLSVPPSRSSSGEVIPGDSFAFVEQKVASALGPMLGKGLIRLDARVRKGLPRLPILPLQMLVYTPHGNLAVVGQYLRDLRLLLDHPSSMWEMSTSQYLYINPHDPPPGGHANSSGYGSVNTVGRWNAPAVNSKNTEVQRSHVEAVFNNMRSDDDLPETDAPPEIGTTLYPHQKKALTFLLEREQEISPDRGTCSVWSRNFNPISRRPYWVNLITKTETHEQPKETKGAILADDMGLGKTITCVSLIAATLPSARVFASTSLESPAPPPPSFDDLDPFHFAGSVWGMPDTNGVSTKARAKAARDQEKLEAEYTRACRIKAKSRATLIICPLSTVSNWEDQFRDHWKGEVVVFGGAGGCGALTTPSSTPGPPTSAHASPSSSQVTEPEAKPPLARPKGTPLRVYVYHGNSRRPDPTFLADFDAVITTFATLASEFSKQNRSIAIADAEEDEDEGGSSDCGGVELDEIGNQVLRLPKPRKTSGKRKRPCLASNATETPSALQSIHWFRVVLDEAHSIKETGTVGSRASCDLMADRRLCLTGTPVQNKLEDVFALIKFLRFAPFDDKNMWTQYIGNPVKYSQASGIANLQLIMKCITLRRTKETKASDGKKILALPPRTDELRRLQFDSQEQSVYNRFFNESKAEFDELSSRNEVMKNYVGILQRILRLRQICDHFELVNGKFPGGDSQSQEGLSYEDIVGAIARDGIDATRAAAVFAILRESATTQCVECGAELCNANDHQLDLADDAVGSAPSNKRGRKPKGSTSRGPTRPTSPSTPRPVLTRCQHLFCIECYRNCICPGWPHVAPDVRRSCSACQTGLGPQDAVEIKPDSALEPVAAKKKHGKREKRAKISQEDFHPSTKIKALMYDLTQFSRLNPHSVNYDPAAIEFEQVDNKGNKVDDGVVKTVVFSQWTSMLDKIEDALELSGIRYDRLDGTMKRDDRTRAMNALKHDPACEVLLVSLKAGGVGLNLTAAQRVYLMDPYWNPAVENQAVDRIHRLGQTRPVTTIKFIIENSIEDRLLEVQRKKIELANLTLPQNLSKAERQQQRMEEVSHLLG